MKIGIGLPGQKIIAAARRAEALGFDSVSAADVLTGDGSPAMDSIVVHSAVAAVTERVTLDFGVVSVPTRPVVMLAAQIQTLQHLSGNRVRLGVGIGGFPGSPFWRAVGAPVSSRGRLLDDALEVLPQLIAGEPTRGVTLAPGAAVPPLLIGSGEAGLRRTAKYADYWLPSQVTPAQVTAAKARLHEYAAEYGRPTPKIHLGVHVVLNDEPARQEMNARMGAFLGTTPEQTAEVTIGGSPRRAADRVAAYVEAGVDEFTVVLDGADFDQQLELVAEARSLL
ncbi:LLM class flavin-dependent oxidoreductase [Kibdelosporangium phytohabitans]|uniref:N5,N10-methylene tetrahydromethanopterin reductase n=1 Tax=Kibdelosporangium phytohabitans TaxID=860235 RepID=A0A0N9ICN6_9PSEU|nr:LLM class flavin-dependent oxidoreductase [Kibdelosporangium phytohabitans]ALG12379.1 N5,N10-methylene tetrahydromethanopterin reductase [Kibdelosporangium phytohabitans]MBE1463955.1 alkanesulfonate monooxygenase SsuD/methylene tetrahydromethanopterin reductase-like flavin-dependent oxidoreductase (luciferase family) [Kibdelosporangium phytohabitans]